MAVIDVYHVANAWGDLSNPERLADAVIARLTATANDLDLLLDAGQTNASTVVFHLSSDAAQSITGIKAPAAAANRAIILHNAGLFAITLEHQHAGSDADNRMTAVKGADVAIASGGYAVLVWDDASTEWIISRELPRSGFKKDIPGDGAVVFLNRQWWNIFHTGQNASGASTVTVFYRKGIIAPALDYHDDEADDADAEAMPIQNGKEINLQAKRDDNGLQAFFFKPASSTATLAFRPTDQGSGLNR
jgi:hypothetical protein